MALTWTNPRTWVAGEKPSAATMNTHIRDQFKAIGDARTSWTPTLTGMTIGNGTFNSKYTLAGKDFTARINFTFGSTSAVSSSIIISLPITLHADYGLMDCLGAATLYDVSAAANGRWAGTCAVNSSTEVFLIVDSDITAQTVNGTNPFTWATGDRFSMEIRAETA